jgi:two-component system, cell cycle response regulator
MLDDQSLKEIINRPDFVEKLYDTIRLVDPIRKEVRSCLKSDAQSYTSPENNCYAMWGKDTICDNCISMRSYHNRRTTLKIEFGNSRVYMVTAVPLDNNAQVSIIELIKDITNDGVINIEGLEPTELNKLISRKNESIIRDAITRIYNEEFIFERLPHDLIASVEKGGNIALFLIKILNIENQLDAERQEILKNIAQIINYVSQKKGNWASRYGETDFVMMLRDINEVKAKRIRQRLINKINSLKLNPVLENVQADIGYYITDDSRLTPEAIIKHAEEMITTSSSGTLEKGFSNQHERYFDKYFLTPREREVAVQLIQGKSNSEIAESLFVGLSTVKKHVSSVFLKTNTKSRAELIAKINI